MMVSYVEHPETASYNWEFTGGCYAGGDIAYYEQANDGEEYTFSNVPIEVREDESIVTGVTQIAKESGNYLFAAIGFLSTIFFIAAFACGLYFGFLYFQAWSAMNGGGRNKHQ
jgi:hypothetical protein